MSKGKRIFRRILVFLLFLIILFGMLLIVYFVFGNNIKNIYIYDNNILSDQEIIEIAKIEDYPDWYTTSTLSIRKRLEGNVLIKDAKVKKKFFLQVHIYIEEHNPLFINSENQKIVLDTGVETDNIMNINVPVLINYVPDKKYESLIKKYGKIDKNVRSKISEIKYDPNTYDEDRFLLYMTDDNYVYVTLTKFDVLNKYNESIEKLEGKKGILYLDSGNYFEIKE